MGRSVTGGPVGVRHATGAEWIAKNASLIVDTRNAIKKKKKNVIKA